MKQLFEIETDKTEVLAEFRELARKYKINFREWKLAKSDNPSPSGDLYFDDPKNIEEILDGVKEMKEGKGIKMTREERKKLLGL